MKLKCDKCGNDYPHQLKDGRIVCMDCNHEIMPPFNGNQEPVNELIINGVTFVRKDSMPAPETSDAVLFHKFVINNYIRIGDKDNYIENTKVSVNGSRKYKLDQLYKIFKNK